MTREEARELLAAYALGALTEEEREALEAHLQDSPDLRRELAEFLETTAALGEAFRRAEPPLDLRERILSATQESAPKAREWWRSALALAAALVVLLGGLLLQAQREKRALRVRLDQQEELLALLASPAARVTDLQGRVRGQVRFVYDPGRGMGALVVRDLQDPGAGFVYQLWLIRGGQADSGGVFRPHPGQTVVLPVRADIGRYEVVAVTVERGPHGVARSQNQPVLVGRLRI